LPSISIRPAGPKDQEAITALGRRMHKESVYRGIMFSADVFEAFCRRLRNHGFFWVAEYRGRLIGFLAGEIVPYFFSRELLANQQLWYVLPKYRGSRAALLLVKEFESWASDLGASEVCMATSSGPNYDSLMEKLGYRKTGGVYKR